MDKDADTPEIKTSFVSLMASPERDYCESRFRSLAAEIVRMGYKPRLLANAGVTVGLDQSLAESRTYEIIFRRELGEISRRAAARRVFEVEDAEKARAEKMLDNT